MIMAQGWDAHSHSTDTQIKFQSAVIIGESELMVITGGMGMGRYRNTHREVKI